MKGEIIKNDEKSRFSKKSSLSIRSTLYQTEIKQYRNIEDMECHLL